MKSFFRKIITVFCILAMVISMTVVPASASGGVIGGVQSFVEWTINSQNDFANSFWRLIFGEDFNSATPEELQNAYNDYVETLPATGLTSDGGLLYTTTIKSMGISWYPGGMGAKYQYVYCPHSSSTSSTDDPSFTYSFFCDSDSLQIYPASGSSTFSVYSLYAVSAFVAPVSGYYSRLATPVSSGHFIAGDKTIRPASVYSTTSSIFYAVGFAKEDDEKCFLKNGTNSSIGASSVTFLTAQLLPSVYKVIPQDAIDTSPGGDYASETRVGSIIGDYGIIGDNGTINKTDNNYIVNETNNTVYNPVTGDTYNIIDWTYDYSTRTYTVVTDNSQTITVNYGDEYVTINEGDTVYNVYYIIQGGGTPEQCEHAYTPAVTTEPTCTVPGVRTYTCSKCSNTYTEAIPAKGHTWTVKEQVTTSYDENGVLVQQGYTIYKCSVCGEEYKSTDGTAPPGGGGGSGDDEVTKEGFWSWIWGQLKSLIGTVIGGVVSVFEFLFGSNDAQGSLDFYNHPSTFSGVSVWE